MRVFANRCVIFSCLNSGSQAFIQAFMHHTFAWLPLVFCYQVLRPCFCLWQGLASMYASLYMMYYFISASVYARCHSFRIACFHCFMQHALLQLSMIKYACCFSWVVPFLVSMQLCLFRFPFDSRMTLF